MILLAGKNPMGNVLHVIQGPETRFWHQIHGSAAVDITPILRQMDDQLPVFIHLSECESEADTGARLSSMIQAGVQYPFAPPTTVFLTGGENAQADAVPAGGVAAEAVGTKTGKRTVTVRTGKCSRCINESVDLVPGLDPPICMNCVKIDLHIASKHDKE